MKKIALFLTAALLLGGIVLCAGCVSSDPIVGQWELNAGSLGEGTFTFNADGTGYTSVTVLGSPSIITSDFSWKKNGDSYLITNALTGETTTASILNNGKTLNFITLGTPISLSLTRL